MLTMLKTVVHLYFFVSLALTIVGITMVNDEKINPLMFIIISLMTSPVILIKTLITAIFRKK